MRVGDPEQLHTGYAAARVVQYELKYIDSQRNQRLASEESLFDVDVVSFNTWTLSGAIATVGAFVCAKPEVESGAGSGGGVAGAVRDREHAAI